MTTPLTHVLQVRRTIAAPRERVFRAWTDPDIVKRWFAPEGCEIPIAEVDARVGGRYRIRMSAPDANQYTVGGVFRVVDTPARLVFTWQWESGAESAGMVDDGDRVETVVTVELHDRGETTDVVVTHELPSARSREGHGQGWESCLNRLERVV